MADPIIIGGAYTILGGIVGVLAGMLGVGGGLIIIPSLSLIWSLSGITLTENHKTALGTAMACILCNSLVSLWSHHRHKQVDWSIIRTITPSVFIGAMSGSRVTHLLPSYWLMVLFTAFAYYTAYTMWKDTKPNPSRQLPKAGYIVLIGFIIGFLSSLISAGGGFISVPLMILCNVSAKRAIGTSAAIGFPLALGGTIGFASSLTNSNVMPYSIGYIHLPAVLGITATSIFGVMLGAKLTQICPTHILKRIFSIMLTILASNMLVKIL